MIPKLERTHVDAMASRSLEPDGEYVLYSTALAREGALLEALKNLVNVAGVGDRHPARALIREVEESR